MKLPRPSSEQLTIVQSVVQDLVHVRVDSVAGAGKTTTILHIAAALLDGRDGRDSSDSSDSTDSTASRRCPCVDGAALLVLTYNAKLKSETRERCTKMKITNVSVHTYHSAALNLYDDQSCSKDEGIAALLRQPSHRPVSCYRNAYSVIVIDEAQDMTHLYFALVQRLLSDVCVPDVRVVVLGDARQSVYGFKGADARFLTLADRLPAFATEARCWRMHTLTTSYRLAPRLAKFVNSQLLDGVEVLSSNHTAGPVGTVRYLRCNTFGDMPFRQVNEWLAAGLHESDIFVLAPSIRVNTKHSPVRMLENRLVRAGVRCYAASSDDERLDEDVTRGKIVFATFHQVKGLERKAVMVFNFDASYHKYYARDSSTSGCPNAIYVAATRASQHLTVLHDSKQSPMRTVRMDHITRDCDFVIDGSPYKGDCVSLAHTHTAVAGESSEMSVTELLRHQKQDVLHAAMACLKVRVFVDRDTFGTSELVPGLDMNTLLKSKTQTGRNSWENVAAITGTAMPCMYEYQTNGRCTLLTRAAHCSKGLPAGDRDRIVKLFGFAERERERDNEDTDRSGGRGYSLKRLSVEDFLYIANVHIALTGGFTHKLKQIKVYDWVQPMDVAAMLEIMKRHVTGPPGAVLYEHPASTTITIQLKSKQKRVNLSCAVDCLDMSTKIAFEIKCVGTLSAEHVLQTALNALLLEQGAGDRCKRKRFRHVLLNLCDGSAREITVDETALDLLKAAAVILLEAKYAAEQCEDDITFLNSVIVNQANHITTDSQTEVHDCPKPQDYAFLSDDE